MGTLPKCIYFDITAYVMILFIVKCYFYHLLASTFNALVTKMQWTKKTMKILSLNQQNSGEYTGIHSINVVKNNILNTCNFVLTTMYLHFTMYDCHKNQFLKFPDFFPTKLEYNFRDQMKDLVAGSIPPKSLLFHFSVMFF